MNRRSFVKKLGLLCLVPFVPTVFLSGPVPIEAPAVKLATEEMLGDGGYYVPAEFAQMMEQLYLDDDPIFFEGKPVTIRMGRHGQTQKFRRQTR